MSSYRVKIIGSDEPPFKYPDLKILLSYLTPVSVRGEIIDGAQCEVRTYELSNLETVLNVLNNASSHCKESLLSVVELLKTLSDSLDCLWYKQKEHYLLKDLALYTKVISLLTDIVSNIKLYTDEVLDSSQDNIEIDVEIHP